MASLIYIPTIELNYFCKWLLDQTIYRLTPAQKEVLQYVIDHYESQIPMTITQAKNFFNFTVQYQIPYQMYKAYFRQDELQDDNGNLITTDTGEIITID